MIEEEDIEDEEEEEELQVENKEQEEIQIEEENDPLDQAFDMALEQEEHSFKQGLKEYQESEPDETPEIEFYEITHTPDGKKNLLKPEENATFGKK